MRKGLEYGLVQILSLESSEGLWKSVHLFFPLFFHASWSQGVTKMFCHEMVHIMILCIEVFSMRCYYQHVCGGGDPFLAWGGVWS